MVVWSISQSVAHRALSLCMIVVFSVGHSFLLRESLPIRPNLLAYIPFLNNCLFTKSNEAFLVLYIINDLDRWFVIHVISRHLISWKKGNAYINRAQFPGEYLPINRNAISSFSCTIMAPMRPRENCNFFFQCRSCGNSKEG